MLRRHIWLSLRRQHYVDAASAAAFRFASAMPAGVHIDADTCCMMLI